MYKRQHDIDKRAHRERQTRRRGTQMLREIYTLIIVPSVSTPP